MIRLDAKKLQTKTDAHPYLKEMLSFPDYYGNNLDALFDCLTDLGPTQVCIEDAKIGGSYLEKILCVFKDARKANPDLELEIREEAVMPEKEPEELCEDTAAAEEADELTEELSSCDEDQDDLRLLDGADGIDE